MPTDFPQGTLEEFGFLLCRWPGDIERHGSQCFVQFRGVHLVLNHEVRGDVSSQSEVHPRQYLVPSLGRNPGVLAFQIFAKPLNNPVSEILELASRLPLVGRVLDPIFHEVRNPRRDTLSGRPTESFVNALGYTGFRPGACRVELFGSTSNESLEQEFATRGRQCDANGGTKSHDRLRSRVLWMIRVKV